MKEIHLPETCLVLLVGSDTEARTDFAAKHFSQEELLSAHMCSEFVGNCDRGNKASREILEFITSKRLQLGKLTIINAFNLHKEERARFITLAKKHYCLTAAIVLDPEVQTDETEKLSHVYNVDPNIDVKVVRQKLHNNKKDESGPFDIIGDVHGCIDELLELIGKLGYEVKIKDDCFQISHPDNRKLVFVGDLVDRGRDSPKVLSLVMDVVKTGIGYCLCGNHDDKFAQYLNGKKVPLSHGINTTIQQMECTSQEFRDEVRDFLSSLRSHYVFDGGNLVVAHAGLPEDMHGGAAGSVRSHALFGETTGEIDEYGCPVRVNWAKKYYGKALVVYGHISVPEPEWINNTIDIDTGCVFGGKLSALRYPEKTTVSVDAKAVYATPTRPIRALI